MSSRAPTYIIAEMACSHEGDPDLARKIITGAAQAGADAIQFQIYSRAERVVPTHPDYDLLGRLELSHAQWSELAAFVREHQSGVQVIVCVYEPGSVDFAEHIGVDAYKVHAADLSNPHLIRYIASTGKRIDLSVGACTLDEIAKAVSWIRATSDSPIWLMYGLQNFPTPVYAVNLDYMMKLKELFELPIGYQDHSDADSKAAFWLPAAAVGLGVDILEKHITHDRTLRGVDHQAALNPDEFARFVFMVRQIEEARGSSLPKPFTAEELKYRKYAKKSIVAGRDISYGAKIGEADLKFMFAPDSGLPPDQADLLIGKTAKREVAAYDLLREDDFA